MNYYPFHVGDYISATRHLSWVEDMAYRRLLDTYYTTEKPLPAEHRAVCRLVLATTDEQREAVEVVLQEFFELTPDGWVNHRADAEIVAMREKQEKQRAKANARWDKLRSERGNASAMPRHTKDDATASTSDADAMPPTPTPTPKETQERKRAPAALGCPPDVPEQVWSDWTALRKAKRAPATETVLQAARGEAEKAGLTLAEFLQVWCLRGSQGLQADWLKPDEVRAVRSSPSTEPAWRTEQRSRVMQAVPGIAARDSRTVEAEICDVTPRRLG